MKKQNTIEIDLKQLLTDSADWSDPDFRVVVRYLRKLGKDGVVPLFSKENQSAILEENQSLKQDCRLMGYHLDCKSKELAKLELKEIEHHKTCIIYLFGMLFFAVLLTIIVFIK